MQQLLVTQEAILSMSTMLKIFKPFRRKLKQQDSKSRDSIKKKASFQLKNKVKSSNLSVKEEGGYNTTSMAINVSCMDIVRATVTQTTPSLSAIFQNILATKWMKLRSAKKDIEVIIAILMLRDPEDCGLKTLCRSHLESLPREQLIKFAKTVFLSEEGGQAYALVCTHLTAFFKIKSKINSKYSLQQFKQEIFNRTEGFSSQLKQSITGLMESQFPILLKNKVSVSLKIFEDQFLSNEKKENAEEQIIKSPFSQETFKKSCSKNEILKDLKESLPSNSPSLHPNHNEAFMKKPANTLEQKNNCIQSILFKNSNMNLDHQSWCVCEKEVHSTQIENSLCFKCRICQNYFHNSCHNKEKEKPIVHCAICHLKNMLPNRPVKRVLFVGLVSKRKSTNKFSFPYISDDLGKYRVQIRCCRLIQKSRNSILFPDAGIIRVNQYFLKEFVPLHKQSSLKFRKDEPLYIPHNYLDNHLNTISFIEKNQISSHNDRIEPEDHLIGVYLVEEKKTDQLVREIKLNNVNSFQQSRGLLDKGLNSGHNESELTFQRMRIPMLCTLSSQRIKYPARGSLCKHFQCFDLLNFVMLVSSTTSPKWICPICKMPAYILRIDCILAGIIQKFKEEEIIEVLFQKQGKFALKLKNEAIAIESNVYELPIEDLFKRTAESPLEEKRKKERFMVPTGASVIEID